MTQINREMFPALSVFERNVSGMEYNMTITEFNLTATEVRKLLTLCERLYGTTKTYFDGYMQDEADDAGNCICGEEQHLEALAVKQALAEASTIMKQPDKEWI